jgi:adenylate cyclase
MAAKSPGATAGRPIWRFAPLAWALLVAAALALLLASPARWRLDAPLYDLLSTIAPPAPAPDVVIVAIDEPSFAEIGRQWPWPRTLHAELVKALREAGAKLIALDVVFSEPSTPEADQALAEALGPDVVLAADEAVIDTPQARQRMHIEPLPEFLAKGAAAGVVAIPLDRDGVLRWMQPGPDSFAATAARLSGAQIADAARNVLLQFRGGARAYATVSYYQALKPQEFLPPGAFKDKIVFVGLSTQTAADASAGAADAFATPFTARTGKLTAGVEAQATMFDALRAGDLTLPAPYWAELAALGIAVLAGMGLARGGRVSWLSGFGALALAAGFVVASFLALELANLWLSPAVPALAVLLVVAVDAAIDYARERRARREIGRAFGQYVSPDLVARLASDPSALKLGGERRTLTILFCDVRGFTTLAEGMKDDPERLTSLVNRLLGPLSDAVLAENGTIDKYIGDCVMAFWNAPLDAPDHAERAVAAGLRMLEAVETLNAELAAEAAEGVAPLKLAIGVGINTGDCVVGNLGSERRFDYTAIGDAVNVASRLESASRAYGVPMLIGAATAERAGGRFALLELDMIAVKGRSAGREIYTALGPTFEQADFDRVRAAASTFLTQYRQRDWQGAERALAALLAAEPRLAGYCSRMAERLSRMKAAPPPDTWTGVFAATEK